MILFRISYYMPPSSHTLMALCVVIALYCIFGHFDFYISMVPYGLLYAMAVTTYCDHSTVMCTFYNPLDLYLLLCLCFCITLLCLSMCDLDLFELILCVVVYSYPLHYSCGKYSLFGICVLANYMSW